MMNKLKMNPGEYILHALKYFLRLMVLLVFIYALMLLMSRAQVSAEQFAADLFSTTRGKLLFAALFVLSAAYPTFGFVRRTVNADIVADRDIIMKAFHAAGYALSVESEGGGKLIFRGSPAKKLFTVWDDKITVKAAGEGITLEGIRRETVQIEFRLNTFLHERRDEIQ